MRSQAIAVLAVLGVLAASVGYTAPALAGSTYKVHKGQTKGPLHIKNPPYSKVVNKGKITNGGQNGVPALTTSGSMTVVNDGVISATASGSSAKAVGISQGQ
jgi:hypothetical protein